MTVPTPPRPAPSWSIGLLFIAAMLAFIVALVQFLLEIFLATSSLRFGSPAPDRP